MPECGSQIVLCDLPVRFDTYEGCTHACSYCFAKKNKDISQIKTHESPGSLKRFIEGHRTLQVKWADWDIPIHWGAMSDPFQPVERVAKKSLECLGLFAETGYPFVYSTKSVLVAEEPYLTLLSHCNVVSQFSMVSPKFDKLESGAPTFNERLAVLEKVAAVSKRLIVRVQPYALGLVDDVCEAIEKYRDAGVYGVVVEGMKRSRKKEGFVKIAGDYCYPADKLRRDFEIIRDAAHANGLAFYCGENRLRKMGDDPCCCGVNGLEGFKVNTANMNHMDKDLNIEYTETMALPHTGDPFRTLSQSTIKGRWATQASYKQDMEIVKRTQTYLKVMGHIKE